METNNRVIESLNELIFEDKHKAYGAYALRRSQNDHVTKALFITLLFFGMVVLLGVWLTNNKIEVPETFIDGSVVLPSLGREVVITSPQKKIEQPKPATVPKTTSGQLQASDDENKTVIKPNEQMIVSNNPSPDDADSTNGKAKEPAVPFEVPATEKITEIVKVPDHMPELANMDRFIAEHLRYPREAVENGIEGIVYVSFVVELDGSVSNIELLKGIGVGCEEEAMRVIKTFPKWKPAIHKGKLVRSQCNLPIKFRLK